MRPVITIYWSVACPSRPPKVTLGVRVARYRKIVDATHWMCRASLKSLPYHGSLRLMSAIIPPNSLRHSDSFKAEEEMGEGVMVEVYGGGGGGSGGVQHESQDQQTSNSGLWKKYCYLQANI